MRLGVLVLRLQILQEVIMFNKNSISMKKKKYGRWFLRLKRKSEILLNKVVEDSGLRQAFLYHPSTRVFDPLGWTVDVRLKTFSTCPVLMDLRVDINEWETFPISDFLKHSPLQHKSPKVSFDGSPLVEMNLFDSDMIKGVPVCYTGGPIWSMAWAPLPAHVTEQYLAVAGLQHMNHLVDLSAPVEFASFIQIWKFGSLDNISNDIHAPTLAWAIAHNFGAVWSMEWCPSGGFDNSSTPYRLGILALATSAGCGVIYSMPRLDCGGETRSIVANPEPDLILKVRCDDVQCTRIVWKRHNLPDTIFGGFSNGTIAMWNVSSTSSILKKGKTLYPYRTFEAHNASITALDVHWLDNCRFMVTSSSDRIFKYWDLDDLSGPMYEYEVTNQAVSAAWMHHWIITACGLDFVNHGEATAFLLHPRDLLERKKAIINIKETFWSVAYSDWNDTVAFASNGGCVTVYAAKHMSTLTFKTPDFEKIVTQTGLVPLTEEEKNQSESVESDTGLPPTNDSFDCSSVIKNNGIKFCDRLKDKPSTGSLNFTVDEGNVRSVNKVCWNQNYNSFNWLAVGYECGFIRVIRVERFDKSHLTKFYKMNENSTITLI